MRRDELVDGAWYNVIDIDDIFEFCGQCDKKQGFGHYYIGKTSVSDLAIFGYNWIRIDPETNIQGYKIMRRDELVDGGLYLVITTYGGIDLDRCRLRGEKLFLCSSTLESLCNNDYQWARIYPEEIFNEKRR